jgi:hypothetical protein
MSEFKTGYFLARTAIEPIDREGHDVENGNIIPCLGSSSPWPWIFALTISITMWAPLVWLGSRLFRDHQAAD